MKKDNKNLVNEKNIKKRNKKESIKAFFAKLVVIIMLVMMIGFYIISLIRGL